jgi:hypothetical protein
MSFFQNIITDSRPRSTQFENSPFLESPRQTMELREEGGGFEAHLSGRSDEDGIVTHVQDDTSSGDYAGSDQRPESKHQENNSDPQPQFVTDQALSDKDDRSKEEGGVRTEHQPVTISETFSFEKKNVHSFEYTVETLTEPVNADGTSSSDRKVSQEPEPERNNSSKAVRPEDESSTQTVEPALEGESFMPTQETAPDGKKILGGLLETSGETDTRQEKETIQEAPQKVKNALLAGRPQPDDEEGAIELKHSVVSPKQIGFSKADTAAMDSMHTQQGNSSLQRHDTGNLQADSGQNQSTVYIGQIDVVIEAPVEEKVQPPVRSIDPSDFSSRHYLRRL